ncbi:Nn.00g096610.m01.CDS01 [Neocucurbitaria sp. VM-36]
MRAAHLLLAILPAISLQIGPIVNDNQTSSARPPQRPLPFSIPSTVDPWIQESLVDGIFKGNLTPLDQAMEAALETNVPQMLDWGITDSKRFLLFASGMLYWTPSEIANGKLIYWTFCMFYYILDQKPLSLEPFAVPISPESVNKTLPLDDWISKFAVKVGEYMDQPGSISDAAIASFQQSPLYNWDEAYVPPEGFPTFNKLFARHLKTGMRPISSPDDDSVVVYPADSTFKGAWPINDANNPEHEPNTITVDSRENQTVNLKHIDWHIEDLLKDSMYASHFVGGQFMHAFLNTFDYHRQHAPVSGTVVEVSKVQGLAYLEVNADKSGKLRLRRRVRPRLRKRRTTFSVPDLDFSELDAPDDTGYQFLQTRGLVIIDNPLLGKVAVLPIGMAQVSSVKLVWTPDAGESYPIYPNVRIKKGDEISNFEFGGSDIVLVFEKKACLKILGATGLSDDGKETDKQKYLMGMPLGVSCK